MNRSEKPDHLIVSTSQPGGIEVEIDQGSKGVKRILLFRPTMGEGGADRVTIKLLQHLDRRRFQPTLVLVKLDGVLLDQIPEDVTVIDLGASRLRFSWLKLAAVLRRQRPDILLSTSSGGNLVAALAHAMVRDPNRCLILSERNTFSAVRRERRPRWLPIVPVTRKLYKQASRIIAVSEGVARDLTQSLDLPEGLVIAIHNPVVDEELYELAQKPADHPWLLEDQPVLLGVGRLVPQKDYPNLLRAFRRIRRKRPIRLIILGEGVERRGLEKYAQHLGVRQDIDFLGFVKNPFPYMRQCTVYVLSSRFEGLPGSLIQAMACGAPVVSTDCPSGPSEIIESGSNGFLVPVDNDEQLADSIESLLDNPALRRSFSEAAQRAASDFAVSPMIKHYEDTLLSSLQSHR
jgi:glycosyltransferase involved in cell wall biosynthesis